MRKHVILGALAALLPLHLPLVALAQANPYNGSWHATYVNERGVSRDGTVTVADQAGEWDMNIQNRNNPCVGRKYTIAVTKATDDELEFTIERAKAMPGCTDGAARFKRVDASTLKGVAGDNSAEFTLKKK